MKRAMSRMIESRVRELLESHSITSAPVDLLLIAGTLNVPVRRENLQGEISGFLSRKGDDSIIVVNRQQPARRQRFTIAHEIGHLLLGHKQNEIHVDKTFQLLFRSESSSMGFDPEEVQANAFAAELLMPTEFVERDLSTYAPSGVLDDTVLQILANKYEVSMQALLIRLNGMGATMKLTAT